MDMEVSTRALRKYLASKLQALKLICVGKEAAIFAGRHYVNTLKEL